MTENGAYIERVDPRYPCGSGGWYTWMSFFILVIHGHIAAAQASGIKLVLDGYHPYILDAPAGDQGALGLGFDRDIDGHLGWGLDLKYGWSGRDEGSLFEVIYHASYFTPDNGTTAFYVGSFLGLQHMGGTVYSSSNWNVDEETAYSRTQFPVGLRLGVRGALDGNFAELFGQLGYAVGNGTLAGDMRTNPLSISLGFCYGTGW